MRITKIWLIPLAAVIAIIAFRYNSHDLLSPNRNENNENVEKETAETMSPTFYYEIPVDSLEITEGKVKWGQTLSEILTEYNVSHQNIHLLAQRSKGVYDVRKLKAGARYSVLHRCDSLKTATHFVFEPSLTEYVIYHLGDSIHAELGIREVEVRERRIATEIESSLYNAILDQGSSPLLVNRLVDIFAWQIDFFRIAKGDRFKIIFEEELIDGQVVGIRNINGAYFEHWKKNYYAIPFSTGKKVDYFDEDGNSLRKTFLKAPLNFTRISSRYSLRRFHPVQKRYKAHLGTDYAAPTGTPIRTVGDGVVLEARYKRGNGNYVKIKHNSNYTTQYLHMSKIAKGIRPGKSVKQGQRIGFVGSTGLATGPHLCFRFWKNGRQVDALKVDLPASEGIAENEMKRFRMISTATKAQLDALHFQKGEKLLAEVSEKHKN